jgi:uncharacterized repeat protein (TIGR01451 family)
VADARCAAGNCVRIGGLNVLITGFGLRREADLSGARSALLTFSYRRQLLLLPSGSMSVEASNNGGGSWTNLRTYSLNGSDSAQIPQSFDITPYTASDTQLRFLGGGGLIASHFFADDVQIQYSKGITTMVGGPPPTLANGFTLMPGDVMTVTFQVQVDNPLTPTITAITNTASVTSDLQSTPLSDSVTDPIQQADLTLSKSDSPDPVTAGQTLTYTLSITNNGPSDATGVVITDTLPAGVTFNFASAGCTESGGLVTCNIGGLTSGSTLQQTIVVTVNISTTGSLTNTVTVGGNETDPVSGNNTASQITTINPQVSLSINDITVVEGDSGTIPAVFTVTLSAASSQIVAVNYTTSDSTATAGIDYIAASGTVTFPVGATVQTFTVQIQGDTLDEIDEAYTVTLSSPTNATIADGQGMGVITDDDITGQILTAMADAWLDTGNANANNGADTSLRNDNAAGNERRSVISFDLSSIPVSSTVLTATLQLYVTNPQAGQTLELYRVITNWTELEVTWNDRTTGTPWGAGGGDYDSGILWGSFNPNAVGIYQISLTTLAQDWVNGTSPNYGIILIATGANGISRLQSREGLPASQQPQLIVEYNELGSFGLSGPAAKAHLIYLPLIIKSD